MSLNHAATLERPAAAAPTQAEPATAPQKLWYDGELVDTGRLQATVHTHALHYGSGVFEGIRAYATKRGAAVFRLPEHLERMRKGAELLGMTFDVAEATEAVLATLRANRQGDAYIRPLAWYGDGSFGLDVAGHPQHLMVATSSTNVHLNGNRTRVSVSSWRRNPASALPPLKLCGAYVNSILAKREVKARGFDEAMFVDDDDFAVECTGANLFVVRDGRVTAVEHRDALPGITRDTLIRLIGAESRPVSMEELLDADEVFACGTAAEVTPIAEIHAGENAGRAYAAQSPVGREIADVYARTVRGDSAWSASWLTEV
ncbi:aminotransferase class IV [Lysobacter hankyongensis]|uniref:branched-chain-amino-acid transaminase n=1 Tax=Lysobacter hankyongensis TaxID=1176535 RepID=A0ABP9BZV5_9GAMM